MNNGFPRSKFWSRAIILVDMNAFFASIEQLDRPAWRGRPVAVTNGEQGTCIITSSYEARAFGVKTGMRLKEARKLCPSLIQCPANPRRYVKISKTIMESLVEITPDLEIFSVDEAFLDVTHCQKLYGDPVRIGKMVKRKVYEVSGLLCSVGVSGDKTTAKYAAKLQKPNGFTVILPWEARARLHNVPVTDMCGIATGIGNFLAKYGVYTCGDMAMLPISILAHRFGNPGRRIWYMCQGMDPDPIHTEVGDPKSMGHGKVMPPNTTDKNIILTYLLHMSEKIGKRLRRNDMEAQHFFAGVRSFEWGWIGGKARLVRPTNDGKAIFKMCKAMLEEHWNGEGVSQVQVTALNPSPACQQLDFFVEEGSERARINGAVDKINERYGEFVVSPARLLHRSKMPNVIAPAWKPTGHRQTV